MSCLLFVQSLLALLVAVSPATAIATTAAVPATASTAAAGRSLLEAVAAVHGTIAAWLERHFGFLATLRTRRREHLARAGRVAATAAAIGATVIPARCLLCAAAVRTSLRLIAEPTRCVELLLASGEDELRSAVNAGQRLVGETHPTTSYERFLVVRAGEAGFVIATDWLLGKLTNWWANGNRIGRLAAIASRDGSSDPWGSTRS